MSTNGVTHASPGQRPGKSDENGQSPEGAAQVIAPFQGFDSFVSDDPGRCPGLAWGFPTPEVLLQAGRKKWERWLHANKFFHSKLHEKRLEFFARAGEFRASTATVLAKSLLAVGRVKMLRLIERQLAAYRERVETLFAQHPDQSVFASLPGAGPKLAPRLLSEFGDDRGFSRLRSPSGAMPEPLP